MTYQSLVMKFINEILLNGVVPIILALAVLYFLMGVLKFIRSAGDAKGRDEGKKVMVIGLIGLVVMVSVWGLVSIIAGTFGINTIGIPQFK